MKVVIALGANIGEPADTLKKVFPILEEQLKNFQKSSIYITKPVGYLDQPDFANAVVTGEVDLTPNELLIYLQSVENGFGRKRTIKWGPRTLDLDLIDCGIQIKEEFLELPHPRAHERKFVLEPWMEIEPNAILTGFGPISKILENLK